MYSIAMNKSHNMIPVVVTVTDTMNKLTKPFREIRHLCRDIEVGVKHDVEVKHNFREKSIKDATSGQGSSSSGSESSSETGDSHEDVGLKQYRAYMFSLVFCAHIEWVIHVLDGVYERVGKPLGW